MKNTMTNHIRELRQNTTEAEKCLWTFLRAKRLGGYKFRRQHLVYPFIVDFVCLEKKLIIELDGGQHAVQHHYDELRTKRLESKGYRVMRFWNNTVLKETQNVLQTILIALEQPKSLLSQPSPPAEKTLEERAKNQNPHVFSMK